MSLTGKIQALFLDPEKTQPIFPLTKTSAVTDANGVSLDVLIENLRIAIGSGSGGDSSPGASYPIGSIYLAVNSTSPASIFGGTWEQLKDRFLLAAGDSYSLGATGGAATHTLTVDEMPSHTHYTVIGVEDSQTEPSAAWWTEGSANRWYNTQAPNSYTGGSKAHNNMPPYLCVCMWKRIA